MLILNNRLLAGVLVCGLVGCGMDAGTSVSVDAATSASEVQARCRADGLTDSQIETLITLTEADKENGFTKTEELQEVFRACGQDALCRECGVAIVDFVND